jgi:hypothetical protein
MMSGMDDEFAELETTEAEFDAMMAEGESVKVVSFAPSTGSDLYCLHVSHGGGLAHAGVRRAVAKAVVHRSTSGASTPVANSL